MVAAAVVGSAAIGAAASNSASKRASAASKGASDAAGTQAAIAQDQWDTYKKTYQPLEEAFVKEAQDYDSFANREKEAGLAATTVNSQFGLARERLARTPGLDPSSAAYTSAIAGLDRDQAAAGAVSQNAARDRVQDMGRALRSDAISLGKGLPAQASAGLSSAAAIGSQIAGQQSGQAAAIGSGVGNLAFRAYDAFNKSGSGGLSYVPDASYGTGGGRAADFSENMQEYGI